MGTQHPWGNLELKELASRQGPSGLCFLTWGGCSIPGLWLGWCHLWSEVILHLQVAREQRKGTGKRGMGQRAKDTAAQEAHHHHHHHFPPQGRRGKQKAKHIQSCSSPRSVGSGCGAAAATQAPAPGPAQASPVAVGHRASVAQPAVVQGHRAVPDLTAN